MEGMHFWTPGCGQKGYMNWGLSLRPSGSPLQRFFFNFAQLKGTRSAWKSCE